MIRNFSKHVKKLKALLAKKRKKKNSSSLRCWAKSPSSTAEVIRGPEGWGPFPACSAQTPQVTTGPPVRQFWQGRCQEVPKSPGCTLGPLDTHASTCLGLPPVQGPVRNKVAAGSDASFLWTLIKSEFLLINTAQEAFYSEWIPISWAFPAHVAPTWAGLGVSRPGRE